VGRAESGGTRKRAERVADEGAPVSRLVKLLIGMTLCGLALVAVMRCELDEIRLQGAHLVDLEGVRGRLESQLGTPLLLVKTDEVRAIFRDDPWVDDLAVYRRLPGEMRIVVHQAQPCLRLDDGRAVSTTGEILPRRDDVDLSPLPLLKVRAEELGVLEAGDALAEFCAALAGSPWPFGEPLVGVAIAGGNWQLLDAAGVRYALGRRDFVRGLRRLSIARERFAAREGDCVDLRFDRQIVLIPGAVAGNFGG
jgi:cell division septal protein FtsQ